MTESTNRNGCSHNGVVHVFVALLLWGILPLYWKMLGGILPLHIIANRIIWSLVFVLILLLFKGRIKEFFVAMVNHKDKYIIFFSGLIISFNWFTYIYAVNSDHIVEASLGYFINPLLTILMARIVLKEKLRYLQVVALVLATLGVAIITFGYGKIPFIALILAFTFSTYSLLKKTIKIDVVLGLSMETAAVFPIALGYLIHVSLQGGFVAGISVLEVLLIIGTGVVTAVPLMLFSYGAQRVQLTTLGFIQYLAPTISLFIGVILYKEPFTKMHLITFGLIWIALMVYSYSQFKEYSKYSSLKQKKVEMNK
ncbi:MAG: EamA family transporter RarD [Eubacteriales bacterium]